MGVTDWKCVRVGFNFLLEINMRSAEKPVFVNMLDLAAICATHSVVTTGASLLSGELAAEK